MVSSAAWLAASLARKPEPSVIAEMLQTSPSDGGISAPLSNAAAAQALALTAFALALAPLAVRLARVVHPGRNVFFARWGFSHVALALLLSAAALATAGPLAQALDLAPLDTLHTLALQCALLLPTVALIVALAGQLDPDGWRSLGLRGAGSGTAIVSGLIGYVCAVPGLLGLQILARFAIERSGLEFKVQALADYASGLAGAELALFAVLAVVVAPLIEELLFRSFLQPLLVQNLGDRGGVLVTALLFAAAHANLASFFPIFALGIVLGATMLRTQRLAAPVVVHAVHNGLTLLLVASTPG